MPLYTTKRDAGFLKGINTELLHSIVSTEVGIYKLDLNNTKINIYEESVNKMYNSPVRVYAWVEIGEKESNDSDFGISFNKDLKVSFLKSDLEKASLFLEEGDIILYDNRYYEINNTTFDHYWGGRNPDTMIGNVEDKWEEHGYSLAVLANCHMVTPQTLNIIDIRKGINTDNSDISVPKFI